MDYLVTDKVTLRTQISYKALVAGIVLVLAGSLISTLPMYGPLLSAIFGVVALLVSMRIQKTELMREFRFRFRVEGTVTDHRKPSVKSS